MKINFYIILILLFTIFTPIVFADATINTGFIPGQIWYSNTPLVEGDTINIYTAVWNSNINQLSAEVSFYDKDIILGTRSIIIAPHNLQDVSISWKVTSGDHIISAKIISSTITNSGKKENITLNNNTTIEDHQFVPILIKKSDGTTTSTSDIVKNQINAVGSKINTIIPTSISIPISQSLNSVDSIRANSYTTISKMKDVTQKELDVLNTKITPNTTSSSKETKSLDSTQKPITYIKLFFLTLLSFILGSKIIFYCVTLFVIFIIIRYIYRKIRK